MPTIMPMTLSDFPDGTYFGVIGNVRLGTGGQTRMALMRQRLFLEHTEQDLPILTFNPVASYDPVRSGLLEQRLLHPRGRLINLHEDLRVRALEGSGAVSTANPGDEDVDDGYVWRRRTGSCWDYLRPDGSLYARTPPTGTTGPVKVFDREGREVASWVDLGGLWRWWVDQVIPPTGRVFFLSDSRHIAEALSRGTDRRRFVLHQMHNPHTVGARRWNSNLSATYRQSLATLDRLDALISLTDRQRHDVARRFGATSNLFVIPNPVEAPVVPAPPPIRRPNSIVMIARLTSQKRVDRGIAAFTDVLAALPDATLDIYGDGPLRAELQQQIDAAGLAGSVVLHGHDPHAREALWAASALWLTSQFEGFPLVIAEARSHGCPVVSFDIKYGPAEQINDGVDGFLVGAGDCAALAAKTVSLLRDPALAAGIRAAGFTRAQGQDHRGFLAEWSRVATAAVDLKPLRTRVDRAVWSTRLESRDPITFSGSLRLESPAAGRLDEVALSAIAYDPDHEDIVDVPLEVHRSGDEFTFSATMDRPTFASGKLRVRVGYVWHNCAGTTHVLTEDVRAGGRSLRTRVGAALRRSGLRQ